MRLYLIVAFLNQNALFKNTDLPNSHILKTFFTLTLKRTTLTFSYLLSSWRFVFSLFLFVLPLVFCESSFSSLCIVSSFRSLFLLHHWFIYVFRFLLVCSLAFLKGQHCFIVCCLGFSCDIFPLSLLLSFIATGTAPLFTITIAFTHNVGGVLNFFEFFLMLLIFYFLFIMISIFKNLYYFGFLVRIKL